MKKTVLKDAEYAAPNFRQIVLVSRRNLLQGSPTHDGNNPLAEGDDFNHQTY